MAKYTILAAVVVAALCPAWASNPGDALRCEDWVSMQPGLNIESYSGRSGLPTVVPNRMVFDNEGREITVRSASTVVCDDTRTTR